MDRGACGYSPWGHKESNMTEQLTLLHYWIYTAGDAGARRALGATAAGDREATRLALDRRWFHLPVSVLVLALALLCVCVVLKCVHLRVS